MYCPLCGKEIEESSKYCLYCGSSINRPASLPKKREDPKLSRSEIKEIRISFKLPDGSYPTATLKNKHRFGLIIDTHTRTGWRWSPARYSKEFLHKLLLYEINKWASEGWDLVETDLDKLLITKRKDGETIGSRLGTGLGLPTPLVYVTEVIYTGAKFHIKKPR